MKDSTDVCQDAEQLERDADQMRGKYLRAHGWEYTSSTPRCVWMWCKVWRGKQWTYGSSDSALRAETWMAEFGETP